MGNMKSMQSFYFQYCSARRRLKWILAIGLITGASAQEVVLGTGNECPKERVKVTTKTECQKAMTCGPENVKNGDWNGSENESEWPSGCYYCKNVKDCTEGTWFNAHPNGSANGKAKPLCVLPTWSGCGGGGGNHKEALFAGDSDIQGWPNDLIPQVSESFVNKGVGGWTCAKIKKKIQQFLTIYTPDWTVLVCGENDLSYGQSVKQTFKSFKNVVKKIRASDSRVLYIGTKPEPSTKGLHAKYRKYDKKIRNFAIKLAKNTEKPPIIMIDSYKGFENLGNPGKFYNKDELHLSKKGYELWTEWSAKAINEAKNGNSCTVWVSSNCAQ